MTKNSIIISLSISVIVVLIVISNLQFFDSLQSIELKAVHEELKEDSNNNVVTVRLVFDEFMKNLELSANAMGTQLLIDDYEKLIAFLKDIQIMGGFASVELISQTGYTYSSLGIETYIVDSFQISKMKNNESYITDVYFDEIHKENIISIALPITNNGEGYYLRGNITTRKLNALFERSFSGEGRYFHLVDSAGSYVATMNNSFTLNSQIPFYAASELIVFDEGYSPENFLDSEYGMYSYSMNDERRYMYYENVGLNDWILTTIKTAEIAEKNAILYRDFSYLMVLRNTAFLASFAFILIMLARNSSKSTKELKDCIDALATQTNKVILEWDNKHKLIIPHSDYKKVFGENFKINGKIKNNDIASIVFKDDFEIFSDALKVLQKKGSLNDVQVRIKKASGEYIWCSISTVCVHNTKGRHVKTLGFVENIQEIVEKTEALKKTAQLDLLTGLYNKVTTERFIKNTLLKYPKVHSALFIIDFDNFKTLNDSFGHAAGDTALKEISKEIRALFRRSDIIGRVGGDEFFSFLLNYGTMELIHAKAKYLCSNLKKTYSKNDQEVEITFSVGISLFPEHGEDCRALYKAADKALYKVKKAGKSGYCISGGEVNLCRD